MNGFKKINLFIGKPNVGKSNILEALSGFTIRFLNSSSQLTDLFRAEHPLEIFYSGNSTEPAKVKVVEGKKKLSYSLSYKSNGISNELNYSSAIGEKSTPSDFGTLGTFDMTFNSDFKWTSDGGSSEGNRFLFQIKRYIFQRAISKGSYRTNYLFPPFGDNLMHVLEVHNELRETFNDWFSHYDLRLVLDKASSSIKIMKDNGKDVFILPYSSIADTLQRIIFYKTAIASNKDSVLIFEEPEAHAYPPYIAEFTQEVINSETNQFFMATHSPIVVNDFLENAIDDLAIFMVDFKDGQTKVKGLSREEIEDVYKYGIDLFFNGESYPVL